MTNNPPALDQLISHINYSAFRKYVMQRDAYWAKEDDPPRWFDINRNLAYSLRSPSPTSSYQAVKAASWIYRKSHRYWNNRAKGLSGQEHAKALECAHCHSPETPTHIYAECGVGRLPQIRQRIHDSQTSMILRHVLSYCSNTPQFQLGRAMSSTTFMNLPSLMKTMTRRRFGTER